MAAIVFNGTQYNNPEDMPPEVRQAYEQAMGMLAGKFQNDAADLLTLSVNSNIDSAAIHSAQNSTAFVYEGQIYTSLDDLPPEARQRYEQMVTTWDANRNGVPDIFDQILPTQPSQPAAPPPARYSQPISQATIEPEGVNLRGVLIGSAIAIFVMLAIGAALVLSGVIRLP